MNIEVNSEQPLNLASLENVTQASKSKNEVDTENRSVHVVDTNGLTLLEILKDCPDHQELFFSENKKFSPRNKLLAFTVKGKNKEDRDAYREGIQKVSQWIEEHYDSNAQDRFNTHFLYRYETGRPLTVGDLKIFLKEEDKLRENTFNIKKLNTASSLEEINKILSAEKKEDSRVIGGKEKSTVKLERKTWSFPIKPPVVFTAVRSYWTSQSNKEDADAGIKDGVRDAQELILKDSLLKDNISALNGIENLFIPCTNNKDQENNQKIIKAEERLKNAKNKIDTQAGLNVQSLTIEQLKKIVSQSIQIRNDANTLLGKVINLKEQTADALHGTITQIVEDFERALRASNKGFDESVIEPINHMLELSLFAQDLKLSSSLVQLGAMAVTGTVTLATLQLFTPKKRLISLLFLNGMMSAAVAGTIATIGAAATVISAAPITGTAVAALSFGELLNYCYEKGSEK
ncbi:MAG: hypothetical protein K9M81_01830 [Chthoniobacterales bacterium]|nr:hypothetical protein [Chthoniobacterales bacterium]